MRLNDPLRLILRVAFFLPLVSIPAVTNWVAAIPAIRQFLVARYDAAAGAMLEQRTIWTNDDLRALKAAYLKRMPATPEVLVLGSSRGLSISQKWFGQRPFFNAAVLSGDLNDIVSLFQLSVEAGKVPRTVILEINPVLAHLQAAGESIALDSYLDHALARYRLSPPLRIAARMFSIQQFRLNLRQVNGTEWYVSGDTPIENDRRVFPDGSSVMPFAVDNRPERDEEGIKAPKLDLTDPEYMRWKTTSDPDEFHLKLFRAFLDDLRARGIEVIAYLAPIHPRAYPVFAASGGYSDSWLRRELRDRGIRVVGTYSPEEMGVVDADFIDAVHPKAHLTHRLFREAGVVTGEL